MPLDWNEGELAEGLCCYANQKFFEAHEHWEIVWLGSGEPEKSFLQALIQIAAAFHHLQRGNSVGAASLLNAALQKLERYSAVYGGVQVEELRRSVRVCAKALGENSVLPPLPIPRIR
jgi:predicted metal-dependent hydrolase